MVGWMNTADECTVEAWASLTAGGEPLPDLSVIGDASSMPSQVNVGGVATACVSVALMAGARAAERGLQGPVGCDLLGIEVVAAMTSERQFLVDGHPVGMGWRPPNVARNRERLPGE